MAYEDDSAPGLPGKVKGPTGSPAAFKEVPAEKNDEKADLNKTGVKSPEDSVKHLPKAGGAL